MNPNNPNTGGKGVTDIKPYLAEQVVADNPDQRPDTTGLNHGPQFMEGKPAGREAKPRPKAEGFKDVRIGS